ncbi:hypothetical protein F4802DRAFT_609708 [Xylaria palmicola]|nr:hypothetical protein F4802DRAFT_609708 [Xylaria palmicola]
MACTAFARSGLAGDTQTLDAIVRDATGLKDALAASPALASSNTTLQTLVTECNTIAESLLAVFEKLRTDLDAHALPHSIYSLKENAERLGMEDRDRVEALRDALVKRLESLSEEASKTRQDMRHLIETWESNAFRRRAPAQSAHLGLSLDLTNYFSSAIKRLAEEQSLMASNQEFLESLYFGKIRARQNKVELAHSKTFQWIFQSSGKAGSGKSTLMKFICAHPTTVELLREWAGNKRLILADFFFWNSGTALQKSREGLLRSLLFEILRKCPELIPQVSKGNQKGPFRRQGLYSRTDEEDLWSQEEPVAAFRSLFFQHMIDSIPRVYLPHMARTLWMATSVSQPQFLMVYSLLDDVSDGLDTLATEHSPEVMYGPEVLMRATQMRRRLDGRRKGLLEVVRDEPGAGLYFEYKVDFLHRTVRDFLLGSPKIRRILEEQHFTDLGGIDTCDGDVWLLPSLSILEAFKRAPFRAGPETAGDDARLASRLLEGLMKFAHEAEMNMNDRRWQFSWPLDTNLFLGLACQADLFSYLESRITPGWFTQSSDSVKELQHVGSLSIWHKFLVQTLSVSFSPVADQVRETLRILLKYNVDMSVRVAGENGQIITAAKRVEELLHSDIGELQGAHRLGLSEHKEEASKPKDKETASVPHGQLSLLSWVSSWWSKWPCLFWQSGWSASIVISASLFSY